MKRLFACIYGPYVQIVRAADRTEAAQLVAPGFDGFPPDAMADATDAIVNLANDLVAWARDRVGQGADSCFRYRKETVLAMLLGESPPDDWLERFAKEYQRGQRLEAEIARLRDEIASLKAAPTTG